MELALDFLSVRDMGSVHDLNVYVSTIKVEACGKAFRSDNAVADNRGVVVLLNNKSDGVRRY